MVVAADVPGGREAVATVAAAATREPPCEGLPWGLWQARATVLAGLCKLTTAWHMAMVLYASPPSPFGEFRCGRRRPAANLTVANGSDAAAWSLDAFWDWTWEPWRHPCEDGEVLDFDVASALPPPAECVSWLELATVNQWSAACHRQFVGGSSQLCYLVGIAAGGALCLTLLRRCSPRRMLLAALACEATLALLLSVVQVFWAHALVRFLLAVSSVHVFTSAAGLCADLCVGTAKLLTASLFEVWWSLGILSIALFGSLAPNWTTLQACVSLPSFALLAPCALLLPESPRWLASRGRLDEAADVWRSAADLNGLAGLLPPRAALAQRLAAQSTAATAQRKSERSAWSLASRSPCRQAVRMAAVHVAFGCVTNTFFGSILNVRNWGTPGMLGLSVGEAAAATSGIAGFVIGTALSVRCARPLLWLGLLLLGCGSAGQCAHLVPATVQTGLPRAVRVTLVALAQRVVVATAVPVLNNCAPRLVPASQRASLIFSCLLFGRVCLLAAPFVGNLAVFGEAFPLTAFGLQLVLAGVSVLVLALVSDNEAAARREFTTKG